MELLFVRDGTLFYLHEGKEERYTSDFAQENEAASLRDQQRHAWKAGQADDDPQAMVTRHMLWGKGNAQKGVPRITVGHVVLAHGRWYYTQVMTRSTGLFHYDPIKKEETRLFHRADFAPLPFCVLPDGQLVVSTPLQDGSICLTLLNARGVEVRGLTEGGTLDQNPSFHDGYIYFNSYGFGRDAQGQIVERAPSVIHRMPLEPGEVELVLEDEKYDFLAPRCAPDGTLYALRIPRVTKPTISPLTVFKDVVLFPVRLGIAVFGFLNAFSVLFGKQSLNTAGGTPQRREIDNKHFIHDRMVDIAQESRKAGERVAVPESWQLIRWRNGTLEVVANRVCAFDLLGDKVVYTSGYDITVLGEGKKHTSPERIQSLAVG